MIDTSAIRKRAEAAKERAEKATPGEWEAHFLETMAFGDRIEVSAPSIDDQPERELICWSQRGRGVNADAEFIAHARTDVPQLAQDLLETLDEIERLKGIVEHCPRCVARLKLNPETDL